MTRLTFKKTAHYSSYLLILLATACSQPTKEPLTTGLSSSKFLTTENANSSENNTEEQSNKPYKTVWERLLDLYALPEFNHPRIDQEINGYLKNPEYLARVQQRAEPYLYFILDEIEAKEIPGELALLPIVESAFRPDANSPAQASGLWQFIPPTGRLYGLKQNSWYDGRRDVVASTQAATTFLKELSADFGGDWLLALASYNAGKGNIMHAVNRNESQGLPTDFWSLRLNSETSAYVPRLLAIAKIFANPEKYNLDLRHIPNEPYFELVDVKTQIDLRTAAELAQTSLDDFFKLNPGFKRWSTDPNGNHRLLIPVDKADDFKEKLAGLADRERVKWIHHTVGEQDDLAAVAKRHSASVEDIAQVNHLESDAISPGQVLLIPASYQASRGGDDDEQQARPPVAQVREERREERETRREEPKKSAASQTYVFKKGDSLQTLARRFKVDKDDLMAWNRLSKKSEMKVGQKLTIKTVESDEPSSRGRKHTVISTAQLSQDKPSKNQKATAVKADSKAATGKNSKQKLELAKSASSKDSKSSQKSTANKLAGNSKKSDAMAKVKVADNKPAAGKTKKIEVAAAKGNAKPSGKKGRS